MRVTDAALSPKEIQPQLIEAINELTQLANNGLYEFNVSATVPTHVPDAQCEVRLVAETGTGNLFLYVFTKSLGVWKGVQLTL